MMDGKSPHLKSYMVNNDIHIMKDFQRVIEVKVWLGDDLAWARKRKVSVRLRLDEGPKIDRKWMHNERWIQSTTISSAIVLYPIRRLNKIVSIYKRNKMALKDRFTHICLPKIGKATSMILDWVKCVHVWLDDKDF